MDVGNYTLCLKFTWLPQPVTHTTVCYISLLIPGKCDVEKRLGLTIVLFLSPPAPLVALWMGGCEKFGFA